MANVTSPKLVRGLLRGLLVLRALNENNFSSVLQLSKVTGLPRATIYRLLDTLMAAGYVTQGGNKDLYRLTIMVRTLSDGFNDEAWVSEIGSPVIADLGRKIVWPTDIATCDKEAMLIRETTHLTSPLSITRSAVGLRVPMMFTAIGRAYLAYCSDTEREAIIRNIAATDTPEGAFARKRQAVDRMIAETRKRGYGAREGGILPSTGSIAVPVMWRGRVIACINMHYILSALTRDEVVKRYLGAMREAAAKIEDSLAKSAPTIQESVRLRA